MFSLLCVSFSFLYFVAFVYFSSPFLRRINKPQSSIMIIVVVVLMVAVIITIIIIGMISITICVPFAW